MKLDKETVKWLNVYGYTLNTENDERYTKIKNKLKELYPYDYYFYIDLDIKRLSEEYAENYHCVYENKKQYYQTIRKRVREYKNKLIKELYGLKK